jgi:hypothetical protein
MNVKDIRPFIPSKDYEESRSFYLALGFKMEDAGSELSLFTKGDCTFFHQKYYNEEFAKNLMLQLIVQDINEALTVIPGIQKIEVKHSPIKQEHWGKVIYLWGPSGELWHVTELNCDEQ